jgi:hypothetical protein
MRWLPPVAKVPAAAIMPGSAALQSPICDGRIAGGSGVEFVGAYGRD